MNSAGNLRNRVREADFYKGFSLDQVAEVFAYLQSVAYNYNLSNHPRMDKTVHSSGLIYSK